MLKRIRTLIQITALLTVIALLASPAVGKDDNKGFIYGRVVTESGSEYTGFLRWGNQEACWDDLFHSGKDEFPFLEYLDDETLDDLKKSRRKQYSFFKKFKITVDDDGFVSRMFIARFGDISKIEPRGDGEAVLTMKNGTKYPVEGVADDVSSKIHVNDSSLGRIDLHWEKIELIEFKPVPKNADPGVWRLYGKVETDEGPFEGHIQWDKQECISTDKLDGDNEDGDISIEMGRIQSIERKSRRASIVVLKDGREMVLEGSNDVNHENRGIMVSDARYGRVTIGWSAFEKVTFIEGKGSGPGYNDFPARGPLQGTVTTEDGDKFSGRLVIDLDESEGWEILNGDVGDIDFDVPFYLIASLEPLGRDECLVVLTSGEKITLEDGQDVSDDNAGVLVIKSNKNAMYIEWDDVKKITFDHK
jgi:hypothetical protein